MTKRNVLVVLLGWLLGATVAQAQTFPTRPVTVLVTAAAGGVTDLVARAVGQKLSEAWGQPVIIENKGGAAHILGAQSVAKATPDGHTLLVAEAGTFVLNPSFYPPTTGSATRSARTSCRSPASCASTRRSSPANDLPASNVAELIALARPKPGELTYGTAGGRLGAAHEHASSSSTWRT